MSDEATLQETPAVTSEATSNDPPTRYIFSGYAVGAAVQCHTVGYSKLESVVRVPALGASVLPSIGGLSESQVANFCFQIPYPTSQSLISVRRIKSSALGIVDGTEYRTEVDAEIEGVSFIGKLSIDYAKLHMVSSRATIGADPVVSTENEVRGIHLGDATISFKLDDQLLPLFPTAKQIEKDSKLAKANKVDPYLGTYRFHLVQDLVIDQGREKNQIKRIAPNAVSWDGFGNIFFAEVIVKGDDRQVTLVRVEMNADVGGSGTVGDGHSNGSAGSNLTP